MENKITPEEALKFILDGYESMIVVSLIDWNKLNLSYNSHNKKK